jgi:beta-phosphoglucomutase
MTNPAPRAVLWDMDGTLVDTGEYHFLAWRDTLAPLGRTYDRAAHEACFGKRNDAILQNFFGDALGAEDSARIAADKERLFRELAAAAGLDLLPGVRAWLVRLRREGFRMAVASSAPMENIAALVQAARMADFFDALASAEHVAQGKPAPDIFLHAARLVDVPPSRCIVVEDARAGVLAAQRAGMRTIGVGPHHETLGAEIAVASLEGLPEDGFERLVPA